MASKLDLHIHTTASDGSDTPALLAAKIAASGIRLFSVTDHDTIDGALELEKLVPDGVKFIRGVEFSCTSPAGKCHILGYSYNPACPAFLAALEEGHQLRREKLGRRIAHLRERFDITLTKEEYSWLMSKNSPGRPHLGKILVDRGMAPDVGTAIRTYLLNVPGRDRIEGSTAVKAIATAGGLPVWAHPLGGEGEKRLSKAQFEAQLDTLLSYGIRGLECWYSRYSMEDVHFLLEQAKAHGLIVTGGSDYHGTNKPDLELGMLNTENLPPYDISLDFFL